MALHPRASQIASCVAYELEMLFWSMRRLNAGPSHYFDRNVYLESALLHTRVLREFLFKKRNLNFPQDVRAVDFFDDDSEWSKDFAGICPYLSSEEERLDRALAHLSYDRIGYETNKSWDVRRVWSEIYGAWQSFFKALPPDRQTWFTLRDMIDPFSGESSHETSISTSRVERSVMSLRAHPNDEFGT